MEVEVGCGRAQGVEERRRASTELPGEGRKGWPTLGWLKEEPGGEEPCDAENPCKEAEPCVEARPCLYLGFMETKIGLCKEL